MPEIIKINFDKQTVSGRELHQVLNIGTQFKDWFPRMCEYGFIENVDFISLNFEQVQMEGTREVKRTMTDYEITVEMAKEIAMLQRSDAGRKVRQYFIELENKWNTPEFVIARALKMANQKILEYQTVVIKLEDKVKEDKPKVLFADSVAISDNAILIGELAKILKQNGIETGQKRLFEQLRQEGFLIKRKGTDYNMPTQKSMELELFKIKETSITHSDGHVSISKTTKVTGKGQIYFINRYKAT